MENVHNGKKYPCSICDRKLSSQCNLRRHIKSNHPPDGRKKFDCEICGKTYDLYTLKNHVKIYHSEEENVHRCEPCDKTFNFRDTFLKHYKSVHEGVKFKCEYCSKEIKTVLKLRRHIVSCHHSNMKVDK